MSLSFCIVSFCIAFGLMTSTGSANKPIYYDHVYPHHSPYYRSIPEKVIQVHHYTDGVSHNHDRYYQPHDSYPHHYTDYNDGYMKKRDNQLIELLLLSALMNNNRRTPTNQGPFTPAAQQGGILPGGALIG
ncbi:hypothetical protein RRG08_027365 [Elysia crispata]|uniref:Uncharacterized protein n=1 Tax=Elysia crispata TaxID=231223 RepID=A0AAE0YLF3_9GAST|nr:hypothetical protein RRG08_027365 [Elysia crispata]